MDKQKANDAKRRFYVKQRELGLCLECTNKVKPNCSRCADCLDRRRRKSVERQAFAIEQGLCSHCVIRPALSSHRLCEQCYYQDTSYKHFHTKKLWSQLKDKFEAQEGKCALSGASMTLGKDAELDHITPSARGGSDDPANTQWVLCVVNRMKDHMLETEFFALVESLFLTMKGTQGKAI